MRKISKLLILILLVISVFGLYDVKANTSEIAISELSVKEKSKEIVINNYSYQNMTVNSDVKFYKVGDYITYKLVLKNNTDNIYSVKTVFDNNVNTKVSYEFDNSKVLEANGEIVLFVTIKYTNKIGENDLRIYDDSIDIVLDIEEDSIFNPITSRSKILLGLIILSLILFVLYFKNKKVVKISILILSFVLIPQVIAKDSIVVTMNSKVTIGKTANFKTGKDFIYQVISLINNKYDYYWDSYNNDGYTYYRMYGRAYIYVYNVEDKTINKILRADESIFNNVKDNLTEYNIVSLDDSDYPIYVWGDNNIVYYYSEADKLYLNEDSSYMFSFFVSLEELDLNGFDSSRVKDMTKMFSLSKLKSLDLSGFDTSNVTNMDSLFMSCSLNELNLDNFDTSNVVNMHNMFAVTSLTSLDISNFDTSNVTDMKEMFAYNYNLTTIYASDKFVTDKVSNSTWMFNSDYNLVGGNGTTWNGGYIDKIYARIDSDGNPGYFTLKN